MNKVDNRLTAIHDMRKRVLEAELFNEPDVVIPDRNPVPIDRAKRFLDWLELECRFGKE